MTVRVIIGNPNAGGRTTTVGRAVGEAVAAARGGDEIVVHELAEIASHLFEWGNSDVSDLVHSVCGADVNIFACPTYKATYTGLLKAFVDNIGQDGLHGSKAVPVMVGAAPIHALAPEVHLRPLLVELGASVPTRGLYVLDSKLEELGTTVEKWSAVAGPLLV